MTHIKRLLCPVDFSSASQHAIAHAVAIARWYHASITGLHVYSPMFMPVPGLPAPEDRVPDVELKRVESETVALFEAAHTEGIPLDVRVEVGRPAAHILDRAAALGVDMIIMGTHGASGFEHLVLGSVTEQVLRRSVCPVLTVPPRAQATSTLPFSRLVCAVDFSLCSLQAVDLAASLAEESGAALTLVHVIEWPWEEPPAPAFDELPADQARALVDYRRSLEARTTQRLEALVPESLRRRGGAHTRVVHGRPHVEVLRLAADGAADLIVMGIRGRAAADLLLLGSTANQIVRRATCPVLTTRH
jgi:nucleotide-binding universal stress UspA family protein